jgi:bifunctional UDP-N-acetylglucosamine pyrophosphorylase/glucosamine-1-phosphate N-acetyltransferase
VFDSVVGAGASVGSNSLLRAGAELMPNAKVGNLAEIKNSVIGSGSHVSHFSYVGDATLGENVNIGAGTITCNYDGTDKHPTVIEDGALIGSSTMLVAPVTVGKAARTGAGSVVRNDVVAGDTVAGVPAKSIKSK